MKKIILMFSMCLIFVAVNAVSAQTAATPAKDSPVRKAIIAVVKKKFAKSQKNIDNPSVLKVQGNWARIVYDLKHDGNGGGYTGVNLILKKSGSGWKIVWNYNEEGEEDPSDHLKGIPDGILNPWDK